MLVTVEKRTRKARGTFRLAAASALCTVWLLGCGGSEETTAQAPLSEQAASATNASPSTPDAVPGRPDASLTAQTLQAAERQARLTPSGAKSLQQLQPGQIAAWDEYASGAVAAKSAAVRLPAFRFFNGSTRAHFYTTSTAERDSIVATLAHLFSYEGPAFSVASAFSGGLSPVYRFYHAQTGVHFYTISEAERAWVQAYLPEFHFEGMAYHASKVPGAGLTPLYRFYVLNHGFHFYTASLSERDHIIANLSGTYAYEGIAYHVLANDWTAARPLLPHTGFTSNHCHPAYGSDLVDCYGLVARTVNPQQDGHRAHINPMSYSAVGAHPLTSCVRDDVTGLVWEGKEANGPRAGSNVYTNLDNGAANDASGHVAYANSIALCGYTDWRLPQREELVGLWNGPLAGVDPLFFPNSPISKWTANTDTFDSRRAWRVDFDHLSSHTRSKTDLQNSPVGVRLVRGAVFSGVRSRFTVTTVPYGNDRPNNVVFDHKTHLSWRRCAEGQVWSGSSCIGDRRIFTQEEAIAYAGAMTNWRMPNIKEAGSLIDLNRASPLRIDTTAFPHTEGNMDFWSSTPSVRYPSIMGGFVSYREGSLSAGASRNNRFALLLVTH